MAFLFFQSRLFCKDQYVVISFDGSGNAKNWYRTLDIATRHNGNFTYFISGSQFLCRKSTNTNALFKNYLGPDGNRVNVPLATGDKQLAERVKMVHDAYKLGHEIASHGVSHFSGLNWTVDDWIMEFNEFEKIYVDVIGLPKDSLQGFRPPYLESNEAMYEAMIEFDLFYDGGHNPIRTHESWLIKNQIACYPLRAITNVRFNKKTLCMDYNFFQLDQRYLSLDRDPYKTSRDNFLQSTLRYFSSEYSNNRRPVFIAFHMSDYMNGAYYSALDLFLEEVSKLEDVSIISYSQLSKLLRRDIASLETKGVANGATEKL